MEKITVTKPSLPPENEFIELLDEIWKSKILTNGGPLHVRLEKELADYLKVPYISLFSNGTLALMVALKVLGIKGEVITTPYSFVATTHSILWNDITPVFVDIDPETCNIDPDKIESAITSDTTAIMPVHVYGNPCDVEKIEKIAKKHNLKVIYDAAHAFGVSINGESVLNYGDVSMLSFHATKVFNTLEGGALVCQDAEIKKQIDFFKNFGFADETEVPTIGINAKMDEMRAAFGIVSLRYVDNNIEKRKIIAEEYRLKLANIEGITFLNNIDGVRHNYSYFPIFVDAKKYGMSRDELYDKLKLNGIWGRRYFYPLISEFVNYKNLPSAGRDNLSVAFGIAEKVICLPIYSDLDLESVDRIVKLIS